MQGKREEIFIEGKKGLPLIVFIHGMGMSASAWASPSKARVLAGAYPLSAMFRAEDAELVTSFQDLALFGYSVLTWSQSRPSGPIGGAVSELGMLLDKYAAYAGEGIIFICHSRGGLIARKYLDGRRVSAKALITLATPHNGTTMARWAAFFDPVTTTINNLLEGLSRKDVDPVFRRVLGFLSSAGIKELLPGSSFYRALNDVKHEGCLYISIGGTDPDLLGPLGLPVPEIVTRLIPGKVLPPELRRGYGDGLVSASSSVLPYADEHMDFHLNHIAMLFDKKVRDYVKEKVSGLTCA